MRNRILSTGDVRKIDGLGRVVIPIDLRRYLNIEVKDQLEMFVTEEQIRLQKYSAPCTFCSAIESIIEYKSKKVCKDCFNELLNIALQGTEYGEIND